MTEEYKVSGREVVGELFNNAGKNISRIGNKIGKRFVTFSTWYLATAGFILPGAYAIPSMNRISINLSKEAKDYLRTHTLQRETEEEISDSALGMSLGLATGLGGHLAFLYAAVDRKHPELFLIPVATNIASGIYEAGRKIYKNAEQRVIQNKKDSGLEKKL